MLYKLKAVFLGITKLRVVGFLLVIFVIGLGVTLSQQAEAAKFTNRSLYMNSSDPSANTYYIVSLNYTTVTPIGSLKLEFCTSPIPSLPCDAPAGLDVSGGTLTAQTGETGFSIGSQTANEIIINRAPSTASGASSYRFDNMINPDGTPAGLPATDLDRNIFYVRLTDYASTDASGALVDYGAISSAITPGLMFYTQVPPVLIFCAAGTINDDECTDMTGDFVNFGELDSSQTYYTKSEFLARTNAQYGYSVTVTGKTFTSGIRSIPQLTTPAPSLVGVGQFGINLATNVNPSIGAPPVGPGVSATPSPTYNTADQFLFNDGDVLVTAAGSTPVRKFTVSYILNVPADQHPGVYSTTLTYVCLAGF